LAARLEMPEHAVEQLLRAGHDVLSLAAPVDDRRTVEDTLASDDTDPEQALASERAEQQAHRLLARLDPRARRILRRRYGLDGTGTTLRECGEVYHISRERVRQLANAALARLRRDSRPQAADDDDPALTDARARRAGPSTPTVGAAAPGPTSCGGRGSP
jgi:RNA polymerase primary sigma factor